MSSYVAAPTKKWRKKTPEENKAAQLGLADYETETGNEYTR